MTYRTILVNFQDPKRAESLVQAALKLADPQEACIVGLYVLPRPQYFYAEATMTLATEIFEAEQKYFQKHASELQAVFERAVPAGVPAQWRAVQGHGAVTTAEVVANARACDLVVVGQNDPHGDAGYQFDTPERLVMEAGRPVLLVPHAGAFDHIGDKVLVAWNGTREGTRAVFDALPVLKRAGAVRLLWINPDDGAGEPGAEMAAALARHGVKVEALAVTSSLGVDAELLARAADFGADLLVMGAYGHSRVRQYVFGGATRGIFERMTVPVLMAH